MVEILVCAKSEVIKNIKVFNPSFIISTLDIGDKIFIPPQFNKQNHLMLNFDDEDDKNNSFSPKLHHAQRILSFADRFNDNDKILVHCFAGISRSTAVALAIFIKNNRNFEEAENFILNARKFPFPNLLLAEHFDNLLNCHGQFIELCERINDISFAAKHLS